MSLCFFSEEDKKEGEEAPKAEEAGEGGEAPKPEGEGEEQPKEDGEAAGGAEVTVQVDVEEGAADKGPIKNNACTRLKVVSALGVAEITIVLSPCDF